MKFLYVYPERTGPSGSMLDAGPIAEVAAAKPRFCVFVWVPTSWLVRPKSDKKIFEWVEGFLRNSYDCVGIADIGPGNHTEYRWGAEAASYKARSPHSVAVYQRRAR